jgi:hypothetical protein
MGLIMKNKILELIRKEEQANKKPSDQWNHEGLCYACEKYGQCDHNPCETHINQITQKKKKAIYEFIDRLQGG